MPEIDLNADLGEGCPFDEELMSLITSANISCAAHAGDPTTIHAALLTAKQHGVQVGAHPAFADREHFGRRELHQAETQTYQECVYQIGGLLGLARAVDVPVRYVKPHGALYNQACRDATYARPIVQAAAGFDLAVMGLPNSALADATKQAGQVRFIAEGFADRRYMPDGSLVPRSRPDAIIEDAEEAARQAQWLIRDRGIESLCVHGDNPHALAFVRRVREFLLRDGFSTGAF